MSTGLIPQVICLRFPLPPPTEPAIKCEIYQVGVDQPSFEAFRKWENNRDLIQCRDWEHRTAVTDWLISKILPSKLVVPLLSQGSSVPSDNWTGWPNCLTALLARLYPPACRKIKFPACIAIEKPMENKTPSEVHLISFHRIYVVVNVSLHIMRPFVRVTHSSFIGTLSATIRDSAA